MALGQELLVSSSPPPVRRPRQALEEYVRLALSALLSCARIYEGSVRRTPTAFGLKGLRSEPSVAIGVTGPGLIETVPGQQLEALLTLSLPVSATGVLENARWSLPETELGGTWDRTCRDDQHPFVFDLPASETSLEVTAYCLEAFRLLLDLVDLFEDTKILKPDACVIGVQRFPYGAPAPWFPPPIGSRVQRVDESGRSRQPLATVAATEPGISTLGRHWALVRRVLQFRSGGEVQAIEAFQLADPEDWVVPASGHPADVTQHLARVCNVACRFCYLFGNPSDLAVARGRKLAGTSELNTRLRYYDPDRGRALFSAQWEINEELIDPRLFDLLPALRQRTTQPFEFMTNGSPLTEPVLDLLSDVQPVHLIVSINSLNAQNRQTLMRESKRKTSTALGCLGELAAREIPFGVSFVATPDVPLEVICNSIRKIDSVGAAFVRVNLPGFTRETPDPPQFETREYWTRIIVAIDQLRDEVTVPILTIPSAFEENFFNDDPNAARILGTVQNSPGSRARLLPGDVVRRVGFFEISDRAQLQALLLLGRGRMELVVERNGERHQVTVDADQPAAWPYIGPAVGKYTLPLGIVAAPALSRRDLRPVEAALQEHDGAVWILTSPLMQPAAQAMIARHLPQMERVRLVKVHNEFLGGNIQVLDMATIGDAARALGAEIEELGRPDLIFVPASGLTEHGRDLMGRHWSDLETWLEVPVELLTQTTQFVF